MSRWMVNANGQQFSAGSIEELRKLARAGDLSAGDIVQPPGASEWIYALEVPELKTAFRMDAAGEFDTAPASGGSPILKWVGAAALAGVAVVSWGYALQLSDSLPQPGDLELIGKKLNYSEVLVTADDAKLLAEPNKNAAEVGPLAKNSKAELLAKRVCKDHVDTSGKPCSWYRIRSDGKEGYAPVDAVIPAYFFADDRTKLDYDPLYNPDQYVQVSNSDWNTPPEAGAGETVFLFQVRNDSKFPMTDLKMLATIKDGKDTVLDTREIAVQGIIPPGQSVMIGTLKPNKKAKLSEGTVMTTTSYEEELKTDPKAFDRWEEDVGVTLNTKGFEKASIEILEVRAVPPDQMPGNGDKPTADGQK